MIELVPRISRASAENSLKKFVEENKIKRHDKGRARFYTKYRELKLGFLDIFYCLAILFLFTSIKHRCHIFKDTNVRYIYNRIYLYVSGGLTMQMPLHIVAVLGYVENDNDEILLVKTHREGQWVFPGGVQQVMTNLIDNAVNYHQGDESIQIKGRFQNELYQVSVKSYGPAIPDAQQARIFERLYRMDTSRNRETGGHGLGLAIAKEIIDKHNGEIDVISEDGINTFWFTLPVQ